MKKLSILLALLLLFTGCQTSDKIEPDTAAKIDLKLTSDQGLIELQLNQEKSKEFIRKINKLEVEKIAKLDVKGWSLYARGLDENDQEVFSITFIGDNINFNNQWYQANEDSLQAIANSYK